MLPGPPPAPLLSVEGLGVRFGSGDRGVEAVRDVSFEVGRGETVALVGESGSGKSVTSLAILRLVEHGGGRIVAGRIRFRRRDGSVLDLARASAATMRAVRGAEITMIFQEPMTSLNPVFTVGELAESLPVSRPAVSQHLKVLKEAGLVVDRADGTRRFYQANPAALEALRSYLDRFWDRALVSFQQEAEREAQRQRTRKDRKRKERS